MADIDYTFEKEILGGGMASVFVVSKDGEKYALKTPKADASDEYIKRFFREVRMMQSVDNEHVLPILESNFDGDMPYYIMPLCECSLADKVQLMSPLERVTACVDFARGVYAIHQAGLRHRDIKPENALYLHGVLKISDLGLGRFVDRDTTTMTTTMEAMGTFGYIPPEYYTSPQTFRKGTVEGDIFMLGKSIYVVCSGGGNAMYVDMTKIDPSIASIVQKCTEIEPTNRYHNVHDIIMDLMSVRDTMLKLANAPMDIKEILDKKHLIDFEEQAYRYLYSIGNDNEEMARALRKLDSATLKEIFTKKRKDIPTFAKYFDDSMSNPQTYIQFDDIDEFSKLQKVLFLLCTDYTTKSMILQSMIDFAHGYNRYSAMENIGNIISGLSDDAIKNLATLFGKNKDKIADMRRHFNTSLPRLVQQILSE